MIIIIYYYQRNNINILYMKKKELEQLKQHIYIYI
jgi:hypothetical protein